ncbi:hypothetical protein ACLOJK_031437 [Asimina triloba]
MKLWKGWRKPKKPKKEKISKTEVRETNHAQKPHSVIGSRPDLFRRLSSFPLCFRLSNIIPLCVLGLRVVERFRLSDCMGDLQVCLPPQPTGPPSEECPSPPSQSPSSSLLQHSNNPHPLSIGADSWRWAEQATQEIIRRIQPTEVSENRRKAVVDYVQCLFRAYLGTEVASLAILFLSLSPLLHYLNYLTTNRKGFVTKWDFFPFVIRWKEEELSSKEDVFPFGSVPLKTYLPDGDIDLTALSYQNVEENLATDVRTILEGEEKNKVAEFEVKDVQYINAEVKLVKCLVQNIVVDISFNQLGGLCALCFLEQVLYRFLDYFSKFDWDKYCVSLNGPVAVSSLPEIVDLWKALETIFAACVMLALLCEFWTIYQTGSSFAHPLPESQCFFNDFTVEAPQNDGGELLLSKEFLRNCVEMFSVPSRGLENNTRSFPRKHLNIVDPLKENNNLGRSVSKGNFYRIRSAFTFGARKLGRILTFPVEGIVDDLKEFFPNTMERHGSGQRPDVQDPVPNCQESTLFGANGSSNKCPEDMLVGSLNCDSRGESIIDHHVILHEEIDKIRISSSEKKPGMIGGPVGREFRHQHTSEKELQRCNTVQHASVSSECNPLTEADVVSGSRLAGDAKELATIQVLGSKVTDEMHKSSSPNNETGSPLMGRAYHAPHLYFAHSVLENGKIENGSQDRTKLTNFGIPDNKTPYGSRAPDEDLGSVSQLESDESKFMRNNTFPFRSYHKTPGAVASVHFHASGVNTYPVEDPQQRIQRSTSNDYENFVEPSGRVMDLADPSGNSEVSNGLADLTGEYESNLRSLLYGQWFYEYISCGPVLAGPPTSPTQFRTRPSLDAVRQSAHMRRNLFLPMNTDGVVSGPPFSSTSGYFPVNTALISGAYGVEEMPKPRGTGTYFPNMNYRSYKERQSNGRGRLIPGANWQSIRPRTHNRAVTPSDLPNLPEKAIQEAQSQAHPSQHLPFCGNGRGKLGPLDFAPAARQVARGYSHAVANDFTLPPPERLEFGTFGPVQLGAMEQSRQLESSAIPHSQGSGSALSTSPMARSASAVNQERVTQAYHLKDDGDFPPLSVKMQ